MFPVLYKKTKVAKLLYSTVGNLNWVVTVYNLFSAILVKEVPLDLFIRKKLLFMSFREIIFPYIFGNVNVFTYFSVVKQLEMTYSLYSTIQRIPELSVEFHVLAFRFRSFVSII